MTSVLVAFFVVLLSALSALGQGKFIRLVSDKNGEPLRLEAAVTSYRKPGSLLSVDLVAAVHIAEAQYFRDLNSRFKSYDKVLYELVSPEGTVPQPGRGGSNPVSMAQTGLKSLLGLEFQLDAVDYQASNFVHADLSADELLASMDARGETWAGLLVRAMAVVQARASDPSRSDPPDLRDILGLFSSGSRGMALRRMLAKEFKDVHAMAEVVNGPEGSALITDRNRRAISVLAAEISHGAKRVAIFYGAAHLPDMEQQLLDTMGVRFESEQWLTAWRLRESEHQ